MDEYIPNDEMTFEETDDFGNILRTLRENQGYTIVRLSKMISLPPEKISKIERSLSEIPNEQVLRIWLKKLGCKDNARKLINIARTHRIVHWIRLHSGDESNADMIRLLDRYRDQSLSPMDRALLQVIAR